MTMSLVSIPDADRADFGQRTVVASHRLHLDPLFADEALIELLDHYPRERLHALNMGHDPTRHEDNRLALHDGVSGTELLRAVRNGRLWLNVTRVNLADARYRRLIDELYAQLAVQLPGFRPKATQGTLLISSPQAMVYYHADGPTSLLWHIRGRKQVWVYPARDERFLSQELLEDIFAGVRHEYVPYDPAFDDAAQVFDLEPGQWITWPQNAPHRVTNLDSLNVSLVTEHFTAASVRRAQVYAANRFLRTRLGLHGLSTDSHAPLALAKYALHRLARKLGLDPLQVKSHVPLLRVDADAPEGVRPLAESPTEAPAPGTAPGTEHGTAAAGPRSTAAASPPAMAANA